MATVLISGANRGIGLEFARQYAADGWEVIATARRSSPELDALGVQVESLDLADARAVAAFAGKAGELDLLIANAGTNHPMNGDSAEDAEAWQAMMMVNAIAPYMLAKAVLPALGRARGKAIAISSGMGSLAEAGSGWVPYRTSKAALNMAWRSLALEAKSLRVTCAALSPGWVKTRMGGAGAQITPEDSVTAMRALIERLPLEDSGGFFTRDGQPIAW